MALTQVPPALLTSTTGTGTTVALSASPTFTGTVTTPSVTFSDASTQTAAASPYVLKNRIINGDMRIDQRNAGASVTITANPQYTLDRWFAGVTLGSKISVQQNAGSVTPPVGFTKYLGVTSLAATTPGTGDVYYMQQSIEGFNIADLAWGTANAKTITISFQVYSSLTGTFGAVILNAGSNRSYPFNYTVSSANTWTSISVTITGDTTGTWATDNTTGIQLRFGLGAGSTYQGTAGAWGTANVVTTTGATSVVGTNGATFYITGVQLEIGTSATPFERRLYNQELANCQRYYQVAKSNVNVASTSSAINGIIPLLVQLRSDTITVGKTSGTFSMGDMVSTGFTSTSTPTDSGYLNNSLSVNFNLAGFSGLTTYRTYRHEPNSTNAAIFTISAEL